MAAGVHYGVVLNIITQPDSFSYGFILSDDFDDNVYFRVNDVIGDKQVYQNCNVSFTTFMAAKGPRGKNVRVVKGKGKKGGSSKHSSYKYKDGFIKGTEFTEDESRTVEFKALQLSKRISFRVKEYLKKYLVAFLNDDGGTIYFGIEDDGIIKGVKFTRSDRDKIGMEINHLIMKIKPTPDPQSYHKDFINFIKVYHPRTNTEIPDLRVLAVSMPKGTNAPVYADEGNIYWMRGHGHCMMMPVDILHQRYVAWFGAGKSKDLGSAGSGLKQPDSGSDSGDIKDYSTDMPSQPPQPQQQENVVWEWLGDNDTWTPYNDENIDEIESAYQSGEKFVKLTKGYFKNRPYGVDFEHFYQQQTQTQNIRKIRRQVIGGAGGGDSPSGSANFGSSSPSLLGDGGDVPANSVTFLLGGKTKVQFLINDLTKVSPANSKSFAIVNAANSDLLHGAGVCGAVFREAGADDLAEACYGVFQDFCNSKTREPESGDAIPTDSFNFKNTTGAKYIIHGIAPNIHQGDDITDLFRTYQKSLEALDQKIDAIVFPSMGTGVYGCDIHLASKIFSQVVYVYFNRDGSPSIKNIVMALFDPSSEAKAKSDMNIYVDAFRETMKEQNVKFKEISSAAGGGKPIISKQSSSKKFKKIKDVPEHLKKKNKKHQHQHQHHDSSSKMPMHHQPDPFLDISEQKHEYVSPTMNSFAGGQNVQFEWQWLDDDKKWKPYDYSKQMDIEKSYEDEKVGLDVPVKYYKNSVEYEVNVSRMKQINTFSTYERDIRRHLKPFVDVVKIKLVPSTQPVAKKLYKMFTDSWNKTSVAEPTAITIIEIKNERLRERFQIYKKKIEKECKPGQPVVKEYLFHGSSTVCDFDKDTGNFKICDDPKCATCNICKTGFSLAHFKSNTNWGRYGKGHYFAENASKAHDYTKNAKKSEHRIILVSQVVVGNIKEYKKNQTHLMAPPDGFHSVYGRATVKGALNYPENVVYCDDAVLPTYCIHYFEVKADSQ